MPIAPTLGAILKEKYMKDSKLIYNLFGVYDKSNFSQIIDYAKKLDESVAPYQDYAKPYFKGDAELNFYNYLKTKKLNQTPETVEDIFRHIASLTQNLPNWNNPGTMINVIPPVNLAALVASNFFQGLNPNFAQDTYAGFSILAELEVTKYISDLIGWNFEESIGVFTFGGKGTNLYATKISVAKCDTKSSVEGCKQNNYFILTSANAHPCHYEVCDWLGLGKNSCIEIPCLKNGSVDLVKTEKIIREELAKGKIFLGCNLNGGSTNELYMDPIRKIYDLISKIVDEYRLTYRPHIHVDSVIGWVYLFFKDYDFGKNPLGIKEKSLRKIQELSKMAQGFKYADSMGIDFHKTGFCPYASSLFICKKRKDYYSIAPEKYQSLSELEYGNYNPYQSTLELTRSATGAISALTSLRTLGISGFQQIYASMFEAAELFRELLSRDERIEIINSESCWLASLFILKPKKYQNMKINDIVESGEMIRREIKSFNVGFADFIQGLARDGRIHFVFTSSRSHMVPGTNISLGTLKAYPMSVFFDDVAARKIIEELIKSIDVYEKIFKEYSANDRRKVGIISDDMVYRNKNNKKEDNDSKE